MHRIVPVYSTIQQYVSEYKTIVNYMSQKKYVALTTGQGLYSTKSVWQTFIAVHIREMDKVIF